MALPLSKSATRTKKYSQLYHDSNSQPAHPLHTIQPRITPTSKPIRTIRDTHKRPSGPYKVSVDQGSRIHYDGREWRTHRSSRYSKRYRHITHEAGYTWQQRYIREVGALRLFLRKRSSPETGSGNAPCKCARIVPRPPTIRSSFYRASFSTTCEPLRYSSC